ncbi:hypothetical protein NUACC26_074360 [Scytonema sp. NUACC26]
MWFCLPLRLPFFRISVDSQYGHCTVENPKSSLYYATPFLATFSYGERPPHDAAEIHLKSGRIAFTTDSYVVQPLFFPGGDIGMLAVNGTVNDLAMSGARPLYVANEGRFIAFLPPEFAQKAIEIMRSHPLGKFAQIIGNVTEKTSGLVTMKSKIGAQRIVDMLSGEQLPRIC